MTYVCSYVIIDLNYVGYTAFKLCIVRVELTTSTDSLLSVTSLTTTVTDYTEAVWNSCCCDTGAPSCGNYALNYEPIML